MSNNNIDIDADIKAIGRISVVPLILEMICKTTGLGFAAVARVTPERWIACEVRDEIKFGLMAGGELKVDTTICHEIRQSGRPVVIDNVSEDEFYAHHHTPAMYGLQSYISIPIVKQDGNFFGTLCAIDPNPALLNSTTIINMFKTYAALLSFYMNAEEKMNDGEARELETPVATELKQQLIKVFGEAVNLSGGINGPSAVLQIDRKSRQFTEAIEASTQKIQSLLDELHKLVPKG